MRSSGVPALSDRPVLRPLSRRQAILFGAGLTSGALGAAFGAEIVRAAAGLWSAYMAPAFFELLLSGVPFCG